MATPKKKAPAKIDMEPLKENELGQVEGGFSEIANDSIEDDGGTNGIGCKTTNESQCGKPPTTT